MKPQVTSNNFNLIIIKRCKNILACFTFVLLFIILDIVIGNVLNYYDHFTATDMHSLVWDDFYKSDHNSMDVIFLGSSHARFAFDTKIFDNKLNVKTFNLSSSEQTPLIGYYVLKEALKYQKPKLLVYEAYWRLFGIYDNTTSAYFVYDYMKGIDSKLGLLTSMSADENFLPFFLQSICKSYKYRDGFFPTIKNILKWKIVKASKPFGGIQFSDFKYIKNGSFSSDKVVSYNKLYKTNPFKEVGSKFNWNKTQLEYFEKTIELCKVNNIKILVVTVPLPEPSIKYVKNYDEYSSKIRSVTDNIGIEYIDYNIKNKTDKTFKNEFFFDSNHLNSRGTELLDNKLIPIVKKYLN